MEKWLLINFNIIRSGENTIKFAKRPSKIAADCLNYYNYLNSLNFVEEATFYAIIGMCVVKV
jgi:hypothetical protein